MKKTLEDIRNDFIDITGEITESYGMTKVAGLLKGLLLLSRKPLSSLFTHRTTVRRAESDLGKNR